MDILTHLSLILFAGSIADLSSPSWHRREAATATLRSPPLAQPALWHTARTTRSPETHWRASYAIWECPRLEDVAVAVWQHQPAEKCVPALLACPGALEAVTSFIDCHGLGRIGCSDTLRWIEAKPYMTGSREGDAIHALAAAKGQRKANGE